MRNPTLVLPKVFRNVTWPHLADACAVCLEAFWLNDWRRMALPWDGPPTPTQKFILNGQIVVSSACTRKGVRRGAAPGSSATIRFIDVPPSQITRNSLSMTSCQLLVKVASEPQRQLQPHRGHLGRGSRRLARARAISNRLLPYFRRGDFWRHLGDPRHRPGPARRCDRGTDGVDPRSRRHPKEGLSASPSTPRARKFGRFTLSPPPRRL